MLRGATEIALRREYEQFKVDKETPPNVISTKPPDALVMCKKRYQTVHPELGLMHSCNEAFLPLMRFCSRHRDYNSKSLAPSVSLTESLTRALNNITFKPSTNEQRGVLNKIDAFLDLYQDPEFVQIDNFISDFKGWIEGRSEDAACDRKVYLEPFQKNLLVHVVFFIAVTKLPVLANRVLEYLSYVFDIDFVTPASQNLFKQKATVFLVPRRHGKTWFTVPIICFLLKNILGISIGYVAHQKHVSQFVLKEVEFRCKRMFGAARPVENKDNVISIDHQTAKSTALFASCFNTNVSTQARAPASRPRSLPLSLSAPLLFATGSRVAAPSSSTASAAASTPWAPPDASARDSTE